jgi:hypothetical protein
MVQQKHQRKILPLDIERRAVGTDDVKLISPIVVFVIVTYIPQETNGMDPRIQ